MQIKLDSIILFVGDVEREKTFYREIFKLVLLEEVKDEWAVLSAGGCNISLHRIGKQYLHSERVKHESNTKLVFETENIINLREELVLKKVEVGEIKTFENYGYWVCDGKDPEGNIFQLKQNKQPAS